MEVWIRQSMAYECLDDHPMPTPVPGRMWDRSLGEELYADRMKFIRRVDELGFDGMIFTEHHQTPNGGLTPAPIVLLAAASQVTQQIKLCTMGIALALYPNPLRVAEELAMIDNLSHGRLVLGLISSAGGSLHNFNIPAEAERARYHEALDLIIRAWTEPEPFEWHSDCYDYPCVSILPRPLQAPHPPIWTTCSSEQSLQWAASRRVKLVAPGTVGQTNDILNYYRDYAEKSCGWTPTSEDLGMAREFFIAPTHAAIDAVIERLMERDRDPETYARMPRYQAREAPELARAESLSRTYDYGAHLGKPAGSGHSMEGYQGGQFLLGDPDTITRQIIEQREACGKPGVLVIRPEMGRMTLDEVVEGLALFACEVMPTVHDL